MLNNRSVAFIIATLALACQAKDSGATGMPPAQPVVASASQSDDRPTSRPTGNPVGRPASRPTDGSGAQSTALPAGESLATFAGGCFWCMEAPFEKLEGVSAVISGYSGGHVQMPTYNQVCSGSTGHTEAVQVHFDPRRISYTDLLELFWRQIDPTDAGGQFVDRGTQYRSEVFVHDDTQRAVAEASREKLQSSDRFSKPIVTAITPLEKFWPAEEYHQDFYKKSPKRYHSYRNGSGRDKFIDRVWGTDRHFTPSTPPAAQGAWNAYRKETSSELRGRLTSIQFDVTQEEGTERPFRNPFWNNQRVGIYVDVVSGEPLFSSRDKFKSGTGWPSFTRPLSESSCSRRTDHKLGYARNEVRSTIADSHLGHVFSDGPAPTGLRYCINSAALRFIPLEDFGREGYPQFEEAFRDAK